MADKGMSGVGLTLIGVGTLFVYSAVTGKSLVAMAQNAISGKPPTTGVDSGYPLTNPNDPTLNAGQTATGTGPGSINPAITGSNPQPKFGGSAAANQNLAKLLAQSYQWSWTWASGSQWDCLVTLWDNESGWDANAKNPSSGAAGIPQDISGNFHGGAKGQIIWGLQYIRNRYGSPCAALSFWNAHNPHWY